MTLYMKKQMRVLKSSNLVSFKETYIKVSLFRKDFLLSSNSSKKRSKQFNLSTVREFDCSFFGRIVGLKKNTSTLSDFKHPIKSKRSLELAKTAQVVSF